MPDRRRLTPSEKQELLHFAADGQSNEELSQRFNTSRSQVHGIIANAQRHGRFPRKNAARVPTGFAPTEPMGPPAPLPPEAPLIPREDPVTTQQPRAPQAQPVSTGAPAWDPSAFGFNFAQATGPSASLGSYTSQPVFRVERTAPPHGHLGTHVGEFDPERLAVNYGSGTYRITLRLPGHLREYVSEYVVSENYGAPKFPAREREEEDRVDRNPRISHPRPDGFRGWGPPDPYMRGYEASRGPVVVAESAASEAIRQMGELQKSFLTREADERKTGPSAFLQDFVRDQDARWTHMRGEERAKEEERRQREEDNRKLERQERDDQWKRERAEADDRHHREMDRLREEEKLRAEREEKNQKYILDLEQKKIDLIQKDFETTGKALRSELDGKRKDADREIDRAREDMKDLEKAVDSKMLEGKKDMEREFSLRKEMLQNEHALIKEKMAREQQLLSEKLELERQIATANTTESLVKGAKELVSELRRGIDSILDHKKMEMGLGPGNVTSLPDSRRPARDEPAPAAPNAEEPQMAEDFIAQFVKDPNGRQIITEWGRQVKAGVPPGSFLGFFMDGYQDPVDHAFRKQCRVFSVYIRTRDWKTMREALEPHVAADEKEAFASDWAEEFYESFRVCFFDEVDGYWKQVAERSASRAQAAEPVAAPKEAKS